jgi:''Cold-shock'' DNA-binding domain.
MVVLDSDKSEVYLKAGSLKGSIFRTLRQGQRINFDIGEEEEIKIISNVKMGQGDY